MRSSVAYDEQYRILLLEPPCSKQQIIAAWKREIQVHHPDRFSDSRHRRLAEERTKLLNVAKDKLVKYWHDFGTPPPDRLTLANIDHQRQVQSLKDAHNSTIGSINRDHESQVESLKRQVESLKGQLAAATSRATATPASDMAYVTDFAISRTYNVAESGAIGMRIDAGFEIVNACGTNTCIKTRFYDTDMMLIKSGQSNQYSDNEGYLSVFFNNIPEYQFNRCLIPLFIPYSEFQSIVPSGRQKDFLLIVFVLRGISTESILSPIVGGHSLPFSFWFRSV
jgi:hypothetical protein